MPAQHLPERIELLATADKGARFEGRIPIERLPRLAREAQNSGGSVAFALDFGKDSEGVRFARIRASGDLVLTCQRCLGPLDFPCVVDTTLGLTASEAEAGHLPERYEAYVVSGDSVAVCEFIEDELLLGLPLAPKHERCKQALAEPGVAFDANQGPKENPFSVLAALKGLAEPDEQ